MQNEVDKNYPVLSREERETIFSWNAEEKIWHLYTDEPKHARKYEKYIDDNKPTRRGYNPNNGKLSMLEGDLKNSTVSITRKPHLTPEQRKQLSERARNMPNFGQNANRDRQ